MLTVILISLGIYFLVVLGIGYASARKAKSGLGFEIASHQGSFWRISASLFTLLGGGELIAITSLSYSYSYAAMWFFGGVALGFLTLAFFVPGIRTDEEVKKYIGLSDFFYERFGRVGSLSASFVIILAFFALMMVQFTVGGEMLATFIGWPYPIIVLCMSAIIVIYLTIGGYEAVLNTDVLQAIVMILFGIIMLLTLPGAPVVATNPVPSMQLLDIAIFFGVGWLTVVASADVWQILFSAKSAKVARYGLCAAASGWAVFGIFLSHLGNLTRALYPNLASPDLAFNTAISNVVPERVLPFAIIFVFAAVMSTADTELFVVTSTIVREFRRRKPPDPDVERGFIKAGISYVAITGALLAILMRGSETVQVIYFSLIGLIVALSPSMIVSWRFKPSAKAVTTSILFGPLGLLILLLTGKLTPTSAPIGALVMSLIGLGIGWLWGAISGTKTKKEEEQAK
jgi:SSS family solute:Na+ symporter